MSPCDTTACWNISRFGECRFGDSCRYSHSTVCGRNFSESKEKGVESNGKAEITNGKCRSKNEKKNNDEKEKCGICIETMENKRFGLLVGCDHLFCMECIGSWRNEAANADTQESISSKRSCPLCREHSDFVVPSYFYVKGEEKKKFIERYLMKKSLIPCVQFEVSGFCK